MNKTQLVFSFRIIGKWLQNSGNVFQIVEKSLTGRTVFRELIGVSLVSNPYEEVTQNSLYQQKTKKVSVKHDRVKNSEKINMKDNTETAETVGRNPGERQPKPKEESISLVVEPGKVFC